MAINWVPWRRQRAYQLACWLCLQCVTGIGVGCGLHAWQAQQKIANQHHMEHHAPSAPTIQRVPALPKTQTHYPAMFHPTQTHFYQQISDDFANWSRHWHINQLRWQDHTLQITGACTNLTELMHFKAWLEAHGGQLKSSHQSTRGLHHVATLPLF